jgi:hypothetical protein
MDVGTMGSDFLVNIVYVACFSRKNSQLQMSLQEFDLIPKEYLSHISSTHFLAHNDSFLLRAERWGRIKSARKREAMAFQQVMSSLLRRTRPRALSLTFWP